MSSADPASAPALARIATPLLVGLDAEQYAAVTAPVAPTAVLAGAGSGKTRVLTRRIAWRIHEGSADAEHVLAVTFTRKAAGELSARLRTSGIRERVVAGTFHAVAFAQVRRWYADHDRPPPRLLERKARILAPLLEGSGSSAEVARTSGLVAGEIEWAKSRGIPVERYETAALAAHRRPGVPLNRVSEVFGAYERERRRKRLVDFDDLIIHCADLIARDSAFAAAQRWRFRHLHVDEFQDASPAQLRLVQQWLGDRSDLFAVGDPDQAIYSFAGADPDLLARFTTHFPGAQIIELRTNYRSTAPVIAAARAALGTTTRDEPRRPEGRGNDAPLPTFTEYPSDLLEAQGIAQRIRRAYRTGEAWSQFAVLARTNAQTTLIARALAEASVPHRVRAATAFLTRPAVTAALDTLDELAKAGPGRPFAALLTDLTEPGATPEDGANPEVEALTELAREYLDTEGSAATVAGFRTYLTTALRRDTEPIGADAVEVVTFHRAKGLEWDTVFVAGLEEGLVPIAHARSASAQAEERRLAYVALSRARRALHLTWAAERSFHDAPVPRDPSPWIADIMDSISGHVPEVAVAPLERIAELRASLDAPAPSDAIAPRLLAAAPAAVSARRSALIDWRARNARANGIPESLVLSDRLLAELALAAPDSRAALRALGCPDDVVERHGAELIEVLLSGGE